MAPKKPMMVNTKLGHYSIFKAVYSEIISANEVLRDQIKELRQKLNVSEKFIEITELLKQSHESLITTNEQLRKQLDGQNRKIIS